MPESVHSFDPCPTFYLHNCLCSVAFIEEALCTSRSVLWTNGFSIKTQCGGS